jgi:GNAT superfamily N-acetyltransferase
MSIDVRPFEAATDIDMAAELLAERHRRDREREPLLPVAYEIPPACKPLIEETLKSPDWFGVVARSGGAPAGFAIMTPLAVNPTSMIAAFFPPRSAQLGYAGHAAPGAEYDVYREMYAVLAGHFVGRGYFDHLAYIAPSDAATNEAWTSLGFGRVMTAGIRGVEPPEGPTAPGVEMHQASAEDIEVIFGLSWELMVHHARAPIFWPLLRESDEATHAFTRDLIAEAEKNAHWVAYDHGRPVGMNTFMPPFWIAPMIAPEGAVYLYQGVVSEDARRGGVGRTILAKGVEWAREQGYRHVALHFASPNVAGAKFWLGNGFKPVEYRMARHVDERIAWAGE